MRIDFESTPAALPVFSTDTFDDFESFNDAERLLKRGVAAAQSGDRDASRKILTHVVALDPACEDAWMWLASISDYPEELLAFLNRVLSINPGNERAVEWHAATMSLMAKMFVKRAVAAQHEDDTDLASHSIEQALAYDENCEDAWAWKASLADDEDEQIDLLHRVLMINPNNEDASEAIRQIEFRREEERRIEAERRAEEERIAAEEARLEAERRKEEERIAAEAARIEEERRQAELRAEQEQRINALFSDAKAAAMGGSNDAALDMINQYLDLRPADAEAWVLRSHLSLGVEEKLSSLQNALAADPDHIAARTAYDFLASMTVPATESSEADEPGAPAADEIWSAAESEMLFAEAITAESIPVAEVSADHLAAADQSVGSDSFDPYATIDFSAVAAESPIGIVAAPPFDYAVENEAAAEPATYAALESSAPNDHDSACPFCGAGEQASGFGCSECHAVLSLADLEAVLANNDVDRSVVSRSVMRMEGEWNTRDFSVDELVTLSLGHLNLGSNEAGRQYLKEALSHDPNNVVLSSQLNALSIRLDEIGRQREIDEARPKGKTILVVDDSATVRKLISGKLEKSGHRVISACDGVEAMERLNEQVPDLVLLDITMPRMDGYEVCKNIRSHPTCSGVPVVMISGKDGFFDKVRGRMAGTTGYVTKPFGPETLMKALETYLLPDAPVGQYETEYEEELAPVV